MQVEFPVKGLDLSSFVSFASKDSTIYDLFAVSVHYGGLSGGHYVAYAKNSEDKQWYNFNDSSTSKVNEAEIKNLRGAYVLFYQRRET